MTQATKLASLDRALAWIFALSLSATVLTATPFWTHSFDLGKHFTYGVGIILLLAVFVCRSAVARRVTFMFARSDVLAVIFLVLVNISAMLGVSPFVAQNGSYGHFLGAIFFGAAVLTFILAKQIFISEGNIFILLKTLNYTLLLVSLYAIVQYFGFDPLAFSSTSFSGHGSFATFANPNLLAGFLVLVLPIALSLYLFHRRELFNIYLVTYSIAAAALLFTFNAPAWFAWAFSSVALLGIAGARRAVRPAKIAIAVLASLTVFIAAGSYESFSEVKAAPPFARVTEFMQATNFSVHENALMLDITVRSLDDHPWSGYGPDSFVYAFYKNETPEYAAFTHAEKKFDNAHNYFLQLIVTLGWPAAIIFTVLLSLLMFLALRQLLKKDPAETGFRIDSALLFGVVAFVVFLKFSVEDYGSMLVLWTLLGVMSARYLKAEQASVEVFGRKVSPGALIVYFAMIVLSAGVYQGFAQRGTYIKADRALLSAANAAADARPEVAKDAYNRAVSVFGAHPNPYFLFLEGRNLNEEAVDTGSAELNMKAIEILTMAVDADPQEVEYRLQLGNAYADQAALSTTQDVSGLEGSAEAAFNKVKVFSPNFRSARLSYGLLLLRQNRFDSSISEFKFAKDLDPSHLPTYYFLGLAHRASGDNASALKNFRRAVKDPQFGNQSAIAIAEITGQLAGEASGDASSDASADASNDSPKKSVH